MINVRYVRRYPIRGLEDKMVAALYWYVGESTKFSNMYKRKISLFSIYMDAQDKFISSFEQVSSEDLAGFGGLLISECNFELGVAQSWVSSITALIHESAGSLEYKVLVLTEEECKRVYSCLDRKSVV